MKYITFSADAQTIERAREEARRLKSTLNQLFRDWLEDLAARDQRRRKIDGIFRQMDDYQAGGPFTREEMNER